MEQEWYERMRPQDFDDYEDMMSMDLEDMFDALMEEKDGLHGDFALDSSACIN